MVGCAGNDFENIATLYFMEFENSNEKNGKHFL